MRRGRLIAASGLLLGLLGLGPTAAQAALLDANCPGPTNGGGTHTEAQTFTALHTGTLVKGEMFVAKTPGADFKMQIFAAGPMGPMGSALGTANIPDSSVANVPSPGPTSPSQPIDGTFSPGVGVVAGQQYAIFVSRPSTFLAKDRSPDPCPGNEWAFNGDGTWSIEDPSYDFPFSTFVNPPNTFTIGKVNGTKVSLTLPGPGSVDVAKSKRVMGRHVAFHAGGAVTLRINLKKTGKAALRRGRKVKTSLTFTPDGGEPNTLAVKLKRK